MKNFQTKIIAIAAVIIIFTGLFPPWSVTGGVGSNYPGITFSLGFHPIFAAPAMGDLALSRLFLEWLVIIIIAGAAIYFWSSLSTATAIVGRVLMQSNKAVREKIKSL